MISIAFQQLFDETFNLLVEYMVSHKTKPEESFEFKSYLMRKNEKASKILSMCNIEGEYVNFFMYLLVEVVSDIMRTLFLSAMKKYNMNLLDCAYFQV